MLNKIRNFARNKKGVSQFVELIVIIGLTVGVGAIAVAYVTKAITDAKKQADGAVQDTMKPEDPNMTPSA